MRPDVERVVGEDVRTKRTNMKKGEKFLYRV